MSDSRPPEENPSIFIDADLSSDEQDEQHEQKEQARDGERSEDRGAPVTARRDEEGIDRHGHV